MKDRTGQDAHRHRNLWPQSIYVQNPVGDDNSSTSLTTIVYLRQRAAEHWKEKQEQAVQKRQSTSGGDAKSAGAETQEGPKLE